LGEDASFLEQLADEVAKGIVNATDKEVSIPIPSLLALPAALQARVLQHSFASLASGDLLEYPHLKGIMALIQEQGGSKGMPLPGGYEAIRTYDRLLLAREKAPAPGIAGVIDLLIPGKTRLDGLGVEIEATVSQGSPHPESDPQAAYLDFQQLTFPLRCRTFQPGDSFIPLGMNALKKLKNFFIDLKIPRADRFKIPLVISGGDICWVAGLRIDERYKIKEGTKKTLRMAVKRL
jgi:tRNA(Ile)-lysidine synthase